MRELREAIALVRAVADGLDTTSTDCGCCGRPTYSNWTERQAAVELEGVIRKLERWDASLDAARAGEENG